MFRAMAHGLAKLFMGLGVRFLGLELGFSMVIKTAGRIGGEGETKRGRESAQEG